MPDSGRLAEAELPHTTPAFAPFYPAPPWELPRAHVIKVLYETDIEPVLEWLPTKLTRSYPPYAIVTIEEYPDTPIGPFSVATQYIGCRAGFFSRALALQTLVDSPAALAALREVWGFPAAPGTIEVERDPRGLKAVVKSATGKALKLKVRDAEDIAPDLTRFDPVLTLRTAPSLQEDVRHDLLQMVQVDPEYEIQSAQRARAAVDLGGTWRVLPVRNVVAVTTCVMNTELPLARFVMPY